MTFEPPLKTIDWDGHSLSVTRDANTPLALHVDGSPFVHWAAQDGTSLRQSFAFTPSGHAEMQFQLWAGRQPLHPPLQGRIGTANLHPAVHAPPALAPLPAALEQSLEIGALFMRAAATPTTIIVPVHNAVAAFARCLASLKRYTGGGARFIFIDDASTEAGVQPLLEETSAWPRAQVLRNSVNLGFSASVNRGLRASGNDDVVLLNADTEVGPGWLGGLRRAAYTTHDIATATAVSDNAGTFSVPELEQANPLPAGWGRADAARALLQGAGLSLPQLPTGNGFCMYIRADARAEVGELDAAAFAEGYGEENDWCQRAEVLGWRHVIAGFVFVAHARSQSFGDARRVELGQAGMQILRQRYPGYEAAVAAQLFSFRRRVLDWRVRRLWSAAGDAPRQRQLHIGTQPTAASGQCDGWCVRVVDDTCLLEKPDGAVCERVASKLLPSALLTWLQRYGFEVVTGSTDAADVAAYCACLGIAHQPRR